MELLCSSIIVLGDDHDISTEIHKNVTYSYDTL